MYRYLSWRKVRAAIQVVLLPCPHLLRAMWIGSVLGVLAASILVDLQAAMVQFAAIAEDMVNGGAGV